jgi:hypothetical protein
MSAPGRPRREYRRALPEGTPVAAPGRSQALVAQRATHKAVP